MENYIVIAKRDEFVLLSKDGETGFIKDTKTGKTYEPKSVASILAKGVWELSDNLDNLLLAENMVRAARKAAGVLKDDRY